MSAKKCGAKGHKVGYSRCCLFRLVSSPGGLNTMVREDYQKKWGMEHLEGKKKILLAPTGDFSAESLTKWGGKTLSE